MSEPNQPFVPAAPPAGTAPPAPVWPASAPAAPPPPGWMPPPLPDSSPAAPFPPPPGGAWQPPSGPGLPSTAGPLPSGAEAYAPNPWQPPSVPPRRRLGWLNWVAAGLVIALLVGGGLLWYRSTAGPSGTLPGASTAPTGSARPSASPSQDVLTTGGQLGVERPLRAETGQARVTATKATWGDAGTMPPQAGMTSLVVELTVAGRQGTVPIGAVFTVAVTADKHRYGIAYGPPATPLLPSRDLGPGEAATGQLGFQLPRGPVTIEFLDADGVAMGSVAIPAR